MVLKTPFEPFEEFLSQNDLSAIFEIFEVRAQSYTSNTK